MKHFTLIRRYVLMALSSFMLISVFQNCGQPGSIAPIVSESIEDGVAIPPADPPPGTEIPQDQDPVIQYKDYTKDVAVNAVPSKVDVLVVVDNSGSMNYEQKNMAARFDSFLGRLQGLDWQIGIVTTDVREDSENQFRKDGRMLYFDRVKRNVITSNDSLSDAKAALGEVIQRSPDEGSALEQGIKSTYRAVERAQEGMGSNVGLIRDGASLSVIVVTDADETVVAKRDGDPTTFTAKNKPDNLINFIKTSYPNKKFKFNSIIVRNGDQNCLYYMNQNEGYGKQYQYLTGKTSGILGNVCEKDYGNQLSLIGDSTSELVRTVTLECAPVDKGGGVYDISVKNVADNQVLTNYTVSGRIVNFAQALPIGNYKIAYKCVDK